MSDMVRVKICGLTTSADARLCAELGAHAIGLNFHPQSPRAISPFEADQIVRDLPDIELIRAGIRHHHERWDGDGYLAGLAGEEIPFVARILGVADAFSAMTTTRPYRKALSVDEAMRRLEDAAGSQLDERLVIAFVNGLRSAADPPLPGQDRRSSSQATELWTPGSSSETRVA